MLKPLFVLLLLLLPAQSFSQEVITLDDGDKVYSFYYTDLAGLKNADNIRHDDCDTYASASEEEFAPLPDGKYKTSDTDEFMIDKNCIMQFLGVAKLASGEDAEFYESSSFNLNGNLVYVNDNGTYQRIENGSYAIKPADGEEPGNNRFETKDGYIQNYGFFEGGKILFKDKE